MANHRSYPNLTRDELVVLLDAFFQIEESGEDLTENHPLVLAASNSLRSLSIHLGFADDEGFRAPRGLRRRLQDFRRISRGNEGLEGHNLYHEVWEEFESNRAELKEEVKSVLLRHASTADSDL